MGSSGLFALYLACDDLEKINTHLEADLREFLYAYDFMLLRKAGKEGC